MPNAVSQAFSSERDPVPPERYEEFLQLFGPVQFRLAAYIRALIHDRNDAQDVFQETNLVLWRRFPEFRADGDFLQWALGIARFQAIRHCRTTRRRPHLFSDAFFEELAGDAIELCAEADTRHDALEKCLRRLTDRQRDLVRKFYGEGLTAEAIGAVWNRSVHAVYKALRVLRRALFDCVERQFAEGR